jgi:hypothetical protein
MGWELTRISDSKCVAEVFYSGVTGEFTISLFKSGLPLFLVEQLIDAVPCVPVFAGSSG